MGYYNKVLAFSVGLVLQILVGQTALASSNHQEKYDEGDFKGFTLGKGYIPTKENIQIKDDKPLPKLKYDEQLGYFYEKELVNKEKKDNQKKTKRKNR